VKQAYAQLDEAIAIFEGYQPTGILTIKDGPYVGVNTPILSTYENTGNTVLNVAGSVLYASRGSSFNDNYTVDMSNAGGAGAINLIGSSSGGVNVNGTGAFDVAPVSNFNNTVNVINGNSLYVTGTMYCSNDIIAFYSDEKLKTNLVPISNALDIVDKLVGYTFDWNSLSNREGQHDYGVLAQEVEKVMPEAVALHTDGYKAVKYERLIPVLLQAIKELKER